MMTSAQVVETSLNVTSNSPSQDYTHPDDHNLPNYNLPLVINSVDKSKVLKFYYSIDGSILLDSISGTEEYTS